MGLFDRVVLLLYSTVLVFLSLAALLSALGWSEGVVFVANKLQEVSGRWAIGVLSALILIGSARFLYLTARRNRPAKTVIHDTDLGQIKVSLYAVENLVVRLARQQKFVRDVRAYVRGEENGVDVSIRLWVSPEANIPDLSETLKDEISRGVRNVVGVQVTRLNIDIENITMESRRARVE